MLGLLGLLRVIAAEQGGHPSRDLAVVPAVAVIGYYGESRTTDLLVWSQVILSLQLGFAVVPLIRFTGDPAKMGRFANPRWIQALAWFCAALIIGLNLKLLADFFLSGGQ